MVSGLKPVFISEIFFNLRLAFDELTKNALSS
jgi:hypothetical protein